jgi:hypothetical protein
MPQVMNGRMKIMRNVRAVNIDKSEKEEISLIELPEDFALERSRHGVSTEDSYDLSRHFALVLSNGLRLLANNLHGWPANDDFPNFEDWKNANYEIAAKLEFVGNLDEISTIIYDKIDFSQDKPHKDWFKDSGKGYLTFDSGGFHPGHDEYVLKTQIIEEVADNFKTEALEWINKNWWSLWD